MKLKLKWVISGSELFKNRNGFQKPAWYYGFAYRPANQFAEIYWVYPLNYVIRYWYRLRQLFWWYGVGSVMRFWYWLKGLRLRSLL